MASRLAALLLLVLATACEDDFPVSCEEITYVKGVGDTCTQTFSSCGDRRVYEVQCDLISHMGYCVCIEDGEIISSFVSAGFCNNIPSGRKDESNQQCLWNIQ